jgi:RNA polymerase sigma-70 factor (sigma-E family)
VITGPDVGTLYATHRLWLVRMAALMLGDAAEAEDAVQDAFASLVRTSPNLREPEAAVAYLRVSVVNNVRAHVRRKEIARKNVSKIGIDPDAHSPGADLGLILTEDQREVAQALRQLPQRAQEVLVLRYWSSLSEAQIADTLGISRGSVKSTASRALDRLEEILKEGGR